MCSMCSQRIWEYMNILSRYTCTNLSRKSWNIAAINCWNVEGALQSPICITWLWKVLNIGMSFFWHPLVLCVFAHKPLSYPICIWTYLMLYHDILRLDLAKVLHLSMYSCSAVTDWTWFSVYCFSLVYTAYVSLVLQLLVPTTLRWCSAQFFKQVQNGTLLGT